MNPMPRLKRPMKKDVYCIEVRTSRESAEMTVPRAPTKAADAGAPTRKATHLRACFSELGG